MPFQPRELAAFEALTRAAGQHRLVTYGELAREVGCHPHADLARILYRIAYACKNNGYPPLTALAVLRESLAPSGGMWNVFPDVQPAERDSTWAKMIRNVCLFNWRRVPRDLFLGAS